MELLWRFRIAAGEKAPLLGGARLLGIPRPKCGLGMTAGFGPRRGKRARLKPAPTETKTEAAAPRPKASGHKKRESRPLQHLRNHRDKKAGPCIPWMAGRGE